MSKDTREVSSGSGVCSVLLLVFILCKVFEVAPIAAWSWWWVFSPLWIPAIAVAALLVIFGACALVLKVIE